MATGSIGVEYVPTQDQLADILTKPLPRPAVLHLRKQIGVRGKVKRVSFGGSVGI